jgi:ubiquinone/menaquinone biosynthesis C-methylase UbiE
MLTIKRYIPSRLWSLLRQGYIRLRKPGEYLRHRYASFDEAIQALRRPDECTEIPLPPASMVTFVGGHDFKLVGEVFKRHFIDLGDLQPEHKVLDVGCGVGRMAIALTSFLSPGSEYWGLDITKSGIQWCQKEITGRYPNFHFEWCDVYNKVYNSTGKQRAKAYTFPFADGIFDFVFLTSVFTHMLPPDFEHYLSEVSRVVKPGGTCLATFFLLNDESKQLLAAGSSTQQFADEIDGCRVADKNMPEAAVAYDEGRVRQLYTKFGFHSDTKFFYGAWCGRTSFVDYQDMIVAKRGDA